MRGGDPVNSETIVIINLVINSAMFIVKLIEVAVIIVKLYKNHKDLE